LITIPHGEDIQDGFEAIGMEKRGINFPEFKNIEIYQKETVR